jgi:hypothetical protein
VAGQPLRIDAALVGQCAEVFFGALCANGYNLNVREDSVAKDRSPKKETKKPKKQK